MNRIWICSGTAFLLAASAFGQGKGGGLGGVVNGAAGAGVGVGRGVTGTVDSTVNGAANAKLPGSANNQSKGNGAGQGLGTPVTGALNASENAALATRLQPLLPAGTTVALAETGFKNQGQFLSTVHVAHNLGIPFDQVKAQMTGNDSVSLGKAIQNLRPGLQGDVIKENVKLAERQAQRDLKLAQDAGKPDKLASNIAADSRLATRLTSMLPDGTTLTDAATGFKNQGQFIAALQVSKSLGIPFADLKDRMTVGQSLGQAIQSLKPAMTESDAEASATIAEAQADTIRAEASADVSASVK